MNPRVLAVGALLIAALSGTVSAKVSDDAIVAAAKQYALLFDQSREAGDKPGIGDMGDFVDKAFADIPIDQLTVGQINLAVGSAPIRLSTKTKAAMEKSLDKTELDQNADGARSAMLKILLLPPTVKKEEVAAALDKALSHPGIKDAIAGGSGASIFNGLTALDGPELLTLRDKLLAVKDSISDKGSVPLFLNAAQFATSLPNSLNAEDLATFMPLREKIATALAEKLKGSVSDENRTRLEKALAQLNGAWARGQLIDHPAPNIEFAWFKDPGDPTHVIKSLADLKGKVVVLDFWATWCGPCIASFPKVKALAHHYRGYDVVVLGITSVQGFVMSAQGRVDTKGDPAKEYALVGDFMKEKDMSWEVGISKQDVFNPDYGVMGIPDAFIIDAKGIVKYAGVYPGEPLEKEAPLINKVLSDDGLIIPAILVDMKPPTTPAKSQ